MPPIVWRVLGILGFFAFYRYLVGFDTLWSALFLVSMAIHEYGHVFAAATVGVRTRSVQFVPPFGVVANLESEPPRADEAWVGIAGPIAGTLTAVPAFAMYRTSGDPAWLSFVFLVLLVNGFNLLPLRPMDGGRVVFAVFDAFWPRLAVGFQYACIGGALVLAYAYSPILLLVAYFAFLSARHESKRLDRRARGESAGGPAMSKWAALAYVVGVGALAFGIAAGMGYCIEQLAAYPNPFTPLFTEITPLRSQSLFRN